MNQTLHIFLKDVRRFWAEFVLSLVITAAFLSIGAYLWQGKQDSQSQILAILGGLLATLVPVSWWVLITRVIHGERLVGDTQFWITRPYVWNNLLAAKLLFLLAFLYVPFFIAQLLILAEAGFAPQDYVPGVLFNLLLLTGTCVLPLAAIATVTSSFARVTLTLLGIFLAFIGFLTVGALGMATQVVGIDSQLGARLCFAIAVVAFAAAIVMQYALRKVWLARGVLIALPVVLIVAGFAASKYDQAQMDHVYQPSQQAAPIQLAYSPDPNSSQGSSFRASSHAMIPVSVRLKESGVAEGYAVIPDAVRAEITAPDGFHWDSGWEWDSGYRFLPGEMNFSPSFYMPIAIFSKYQSMPVSVHLTFAITQVQAGKATTIPMSIERFSVPDFGNCSGQTGWAPMVGQATGIHCVAALREPQLTYISTRWSDGPCSGSPVGPDSGVVGTAWAGSLDREPAQIGISPIVEPNVSLSNSQIGNAQGKARYLCAGTPITFTQYNRVSRRQISMDIQGFLLPKMSMQGNTITVTQ